MASDIQARANEFYAKRHARWQKEWDRQELQRKRERDEHQRAVRAVQWRGRLGRIERALVRAKAHLRYTPQDEKLRAEVAELEAMYRAVLDERAG